MHVYAHKADTMTGILNHTHTGQNNHHDCCQQQRHTHIHKQKEMRDIWLQMPSTRLSLSFPVRLMMPHALSPQTITLLWATMISSLALVTQVGEETRISLSQSLSPNISLLSISLFRLLLLLSYLKTRP